MRELETVPPEAVNREARLFHRDGFVAIKDALSLYQLVRLRTACEELS